MLSSGEVAGAAGMGISDWLRVFRALHEQAKAGGLPREDAADYRAGCEELARALLAARKLAPRSGETALQALRVPRAVQVDLVAKSWPSRVTTVELGVGGFSALLARVPLAGEELRCTMKVPGGAPIEATVSATEAKQQPGTVRAVFTFKSLGEAQRTALEKLVIDTALAQIAA